MQIRALREALYRAARETDTLRREADALREALKCERQRHTDLELRYKQVVQAVGSRPSEIDSVREENRRLRALIADGSAERLKLLEDLRLATPPQPVRKAPVPADPEVTYEL